MLPDNFPKTKAYGYGGLVYPYNYEQCNNKNSEYICSTPGPTFLARTNQPINVIWNNKIKNKHILPIDPTLHWANPNNISKPNKPWPNYPPGFDLAQFPVPVVTHLHGGETIPKFDGYPNSWFTFNGITGSSYETNKYLYLNKQQSSNLFYHDHALGITRLNVYAGLVGAYIIKDSNNYLDSKEDTPLPNGKFDIPLIIQDKSFNEDGSLNFSSDSLNPNLHPYWRGFIFGNTNLVNGKVWPNLDVHQTAYRFRIVNASNFRFYKFKLSNNKSFIQIGSDSGYLSKPVYIDEITLAPAERADIIIDFSKCSIGEKIILLNINDDRQTDPDTTGQVMRFNVKYSFSNKNLSLPNKLNIIPKLRENVSKKIVTLVPSINEFGFDSLLLDGQRWYSQVSEKPIVGSTQVWEIINMTNGAHPIHIHLINFQVLSRQKIDIKSYSKDWHTINGNPPLNHPTKVIDPNTYLIGNPIFAHENEKGWKDTVVCYPDQVTRIMVPMFPSNIDPSLAFPGKNLFPFDPSQSPGYVWHCHMLEHEDNEMMRPMHILFKDEYE